MPLNHTQTASPKPAPAELGSSRRGRQRPDGTFACEYCDDCGDVHSVIGDWLGVCHCEAGRELQAEIDARRAERATAGSADRG